MRYLDMYSSYLKQFIGERVMVQISDGENNTTFSDVLLDYIDKDIIAIKQKDGVIFYFDTQYLVVMGRGNIKTKTKNIDEDSRESYA